MSPFFFFYNAFGRGIKLSKGAKPTGANLARNLEKVGVKRPPNTQAHHIVAGTAASAERARDVLKRFEIDINSPNNGVFLPKKGGTPISGSPHSGPHPPAYYELVNERIISAAAGGKISVLNELGQIKLELLGGMIPVKY